MKFGESSDWVQFLGTFDAKRDCIMGHEFVTRIEELGDGVDAAPTSIDGEPLASDRADAVIVMMPDGETQPDYRRLQLVDSPLPVVRAWLEPAEAKSTG